MSNIYTNSRVYCSSSKPFNKNQVDKNYLFSSIDLFFCPKCLSPKALYQTYFEIVYKFCSNCLTDFTRSKDQHTCSKNCFICPECSSNLEISFENHNNNSKSFNFKCVYCKYYFKTPIINKPKPLISIINECKTDPFNVLCHKISDELRDTNMSEKLSERAIKNLQFISKESIEDKKEQITTAKYPMPKKLTTKKSIFCMSCRTVLFAPIVENVPPLTNKVLIKYNAVDYLPHISSSKLIDNIHLLNFINPLKTKVYLEILIPNNENCKTEITTTEFILGPKSSNIVKTIPTAYLTESTSQSKSELILRKGGKMYQEPTVDNYHEFFEKGINWISIPIVVSSDEKEVELPIHVKLTCDELPEKELTKIETSYWSIIVIR
ncbi:uncharacterized protein KGF55_003847 [Candida pseudojiufengensis]|uniref:uncharacterized protein n=1 Tax=Candida pseudojiufengensis TaxID=497109 RepID=UPI002224871B|nr:uncharacterized protein KGF55_003847 [Candida pseudojiufengensis]KAI5961876.1 hypothetical protein KGF55_003847 [Candida pseudojiufengensis]